jgi:glutamate synthase domain-containing protein 2/glutamate synthase domain-containing protein 1/glutamate synthase domain-containing protein 3
MEISDKGGRPAKQGLYDFQNEHDACGVGFLANINGKKTHSIVQKGVEVLRRLLHRGAAGGDPDTGDGAGILLQIPDDFLKTASNLKFDLPDAGKYGVGMTFLPKDPEKHDKCVAIIEQITASEGHRLLGWRDVPVDENALGPMARSTCPRISQFFVDVKTSGMGADPVERKLYVLRRLIGKAVAAEIGEGDFYIASLSCRTIVYKGLLMAPQVPKFFPDLMNEKFVSALAIVHQRYSTNTFPTWSLAQPFRYLAHNGEINTLRGNINQMRGREKSFHSAIFGDELKKLLPIIQENQSDSACLDNALELLYSCDRSLPHSMMMLVPQAWGQAYHLGNDLRGFFEYHAALMEPWDGPSALAFSDGRSVGALLDRNGLRPARYTITKDDFIILASETGVLDIPPENVHKKGRLGPGQMIHVDIESKRVLFDNELKNRVSRWHPYRRWVEENKISLHGLFDSVTPPKIDAPTLLKRQKLFGYTREDVNIILKQMAVTGSEPTGSMGNDAALAVLSEKPQLLYNYFKQLFAQVTNPPIDPIREKLVMSLMTFIGNQSNVLDESPRHAHLVKLKTPILTNEDLSKLKSSEDSHFRTVTLQAAFDPNDGGSGLDKAVLKLAEKAEEVVKDGHSVVIISDKDIPDDKAPIPMLLAVSSINTRLTECGLRTSAGLVVETGEAREIMHFVLLFGYAATAVNPYLAFETLVDIVEKSNDVSISPTKAVENYIEAICKGVRKVMSKMGISTLRSYRGSQVFEAIGLDKKLVEQYFSGTSSRIGGIGMQEIAAEAKARYETANSATPSPILDGGGNYHFRKDGERHLWTPETITLLQQAVRNKDSEAYRSYAKIINNQERNLCTLRGLFSFKPAKSIPLDEVEPATEIVKRFVTGAMSFGSISKEAHEAMALAMNFLGGKSNSGEGGEDPERFKQLADGSSKCSAIKQIASGRFGVTAEYLASAQELQIKIAQGAKPGEGGQLPGHKVNELIAKVRHSTPGVTLISPPPHHDIYSIEDLAQLIYDLKNANPAARVSVKLVSEVGVGTVAAGVAKGHADMVLISGHDGGTGASPLTSIKHAGAPWELGLAETQQTLVMNKLRDRIKVQVDGQLKTGRDVIIGALLGAEEFGFATTALVTLGCVMMRKCHSNTCPVGVATQDPELRKRFKGKPEHVVNFMMFIAEDVRERLAELGFRSIDEAVGRSDLLETNEAMNFWKAKNLDFSDLFAKIADAALPTKCATTQDHGIDKAFDQQIIAELGDAVEKGEKASMNTTISNIDRTAGAMLSNKVALQYGNEGLPDDTITVNFTGCAGQSFGVFLAKGITFNLLGEANDYVGKGLSGGRIVVKAPRIENFDPSENMIAGNVLLYGATSGKLFLGGQAGERFAIRNSGAIAVTEGVGDHCCEYMTGGRIVVIGPTGVNFAAGMSGGLAYVFDESNDFDRRCNLEMVDLEPLKEEKDVAELKALLTEHVEYTGSEKAKRILDNWEVSAPMFIKVFPVEYRKALGKMMKDDAEVKRDIREY